jgi:hypothetical protein
MIGALNILPGTRSPNLKIQARDESMLRWLVQRLLCQIECSGDLIRISRMGPSCNYVHIFPSRFRVYTEPLPALSFFFSPAPKVC